MDYFFSFYETIFRIQLQNKSKRYPQKRSERPPNNKVSKIKKLYNRLLSCRKNFLRKFIDSWIIQHGKNIIIFSMSLFKKLCKYKLYK